MALLIRRSFPICTSCHRAFATSSRLRIQAQQTSDEPPVSELPPYPYGAAQWYKQSDRGLYHGQRIHFGNNVGPKSGKRTRRTWQINVQRKRLFSKALNRHVQIKVSRKALRTIEKVGGLDEYLLGETEGRIKGLGLKGWELRWAIMQTPAVKRRFREQRKALGLEALEEDVERLELEKLAAVELEEVLGSAAPVELEVDEGINELEDSNAEAASIASESLLDESAKQNLQEESWQDIEEAAEAEATTATTPDLANQPHYPRLQVERQRFMFLTTSGWRKSLPKVKKSKLPTKESVLKAHLKPQVKTAWNVLKSHNAAIQEEGQPAMSRKERLFILRKVQQTMREELEKSKLVQRDLNQKMAAIETKARRKERNRVLKEEAAKVKLLAKEEKAATRRARKLAVGGNATEN